MPKAIYKAQQAKKKMAQIEVVGVSETVNILINGINEVLEVDVNTESMRSQFPTMSNEDLEKLVKKLKEDIKAAINDGKKKLEKELMNSANLDELKGLLGG